MVKSDENEILEVELHYEQDSKRFHRYRIESDEGIMGSVYLPKDAKRLPLKIMMVRKN